MINDWLINFDSLNICSRLDMQSIPNYPVPPDVWKSAESKEPLPLDFSTELYRKKQQHYHKGYRTMIHLEEAAQTIFMRTFDQTEVRIQYAGTGRIFSFLNEVKYILLKCPKSISCH